MSTEQFAAEFCLQLFISSVWTKTLGTGAGLESCCLPDYTPRDQSPGVFPGARTLGIRAIVLSYGYTSQRGKARRASPVRRLARNGSPSFSTWKYSQTR